MEPMPKQRSTPAISVCIPVYNEKQNVAEVIRRVSAVLAVETGATHEILFTDDGSTDGTSSEIRNHAVTAAGITIRVIRLSRNFGHQTALTAALELARGDVAFILDGDLQDRPEELPRFLSLYRVGYDVIYGIRTKRKESIALRSAYFLFYRLLGLFSDFPLPVDSGDHALISRRALDELNRSPERNRFVRGIRSWVGFRQIGLEVERDPRHAGTTKYSFKRLLRLAADGIFSFSTAPLRIATATGFATVVLGGLFGFYLLYDKLANGNPPRGFTALAELLILFSGIQLLSLGIMGEYVGRIYHEVKGRRLYVVDELWSSDQERPEDPNRKA